MTPLLQDGAGDRLILTLKQQSQSLQAAFLTQALGVEHLHLPAGLPPSANTASRGWLLPAIGVAIISPTPQQRERLGVTEWGAPLAGHSLPDDVLAVEPELRCSAASLPCVDDATASWGVHATQAATSGFTGRGVRVAILDTGLPDGHAGFGTRVRAAESFVPGSGVHDALSSHGLACAGIVGGGRITGDLRRLGVATEADLYIGRVLGDDETGLSSWILTGIDWALRHDCQVVSLSLASKSPAVKQSPAFERAGQQAYSAGSLLIASAGNYSATDAIGHPANVDSILAVGAVDEWLRPTIFSPMSRPPLPGAAVDVVGPGIRAASFHQTLGWDRFLGTSFATAYVAGLATLHVEASRSIGAPTYGLALRNRLVTSVISANGPANRVGHGLAVAP